MGRDQLPRRAFLDPAATIALDGWAFAALAVTIAGDRRHARARHRPADALLRPSGSSPGAAQAPLPRGVIADVVLLVLSVVALVALATSGALAGRLDPIASAAPGLIALGDRRRGGAAGAVRLPSRRLREPSTPTGSPRSWPSADRSPAAVLRQARVLIIALCLACFATSAWAVARSNRLRTARFTVGSSVVATVSRTASVSSRRSTEVDPRGRFAMAAVTHRRPRARRSSPSIIALRDRRSLARAASRAPRSPPPAARSILRPRPGQHSPGAPCACDATVSATARQRAGLAQHSSSAMGVQPAERDQRSSSLGAAAQRACRLSRARSRPVPRRLSAGRPRPGARVGASRAAQRARSSSTVSGYRRPLAGREARRSRR